VDGLFSYFGWVSDERGHHLTNPFFVSIPYFEEDSSQSAKIAAENEKLFVS
jgi:hypothetical protein